MNPNPPLNDRERLLLWALQTALSYLPTHKKYSDPLLHQAVSIQNEAMRMAQESSADGDGDGELRAVSNGDGDGDGRHNVISLREYVLTHYGIQGPGGE